jgi:hypothetical protein
MEPNMMVDLVHVADAIALMVGIGINSEGMNYKASSEIKKRLNLSRNTVEIVASQLLPDFLELNEVLAMRAARLHLQ